MIVAWIEVHQAVFSHRKTFELATLLGVDETYAAGHLIRLWTWALDNAPDGDLSKLSDRAIAYGAGWRHQTTLFVQALTDAGWLDGDRSIHDWSEYAGRLVERRRLDAERKREQRQSIGRPMDGSKTADRTAIGVRRTVPDPTVPDSTGQDRSPPNPPQAGGDPSGNGRGESRRRRRGEVPTDPSEYTSGPYGAIVAARMAAKADEGGTRC